jgi:hypothetical protein
MIGLFSSSTLELMVFHLLAMIQPQRLPLGLPQ